MRYRSIYKLLCILIFTVSFCIVINFRLSYLIANTLHLIILSIRLFCCKYLFSTQLPILPTFIDLVSCSYTTLKIALIHRDRWREDSPAPSEEEIGGRKPSSFMRHLRAQEQEKLLQIIWTNRLPRVMQSILLTQPLRPKDEIQRLSRVVDQYSKL